MSEPLQIAEIFTSIQGESSRVGLPCTMVRLAGCNLRCEWCDTPYARTVEGAEVMSVADVLAEVRRRQCGRVEITGGEPLLQPACRDLLEKLCSLGYETMLETNGSLDVSGLPESLRRIVDVKCPSSGQVERNLWDNLALLGGNDEVKFVLADRADYEFAVETICRRSLLGRCEVIFSPVADRLEPAALAEWILTDGLDVRLGIQLHKILWPGRDRGV
jgi:7-carboxy-7-deazaguanine synthase